MCPRTISFSSRDLLVDPVATLVGGCFDTWVVPRLVKANGGVPCGFPFKQPPKGYKLQAQAGKDSSKGTAHLRVYKGVGVSVQGTPPRSPSKIQRKLNLFRRLLHRSFAAMALQHHKSLQISLGQTPHAESHEFRGFGG